nr:nucleoporin [Quercus suber]
MADYFPSLDKCLAGHSRLISWKAAWRALCDVASARDDVATTLQQFFHTPESSQILRNALAPFAAPSPASKRDFESKTAPIHISGAVNGEYSVEEIKADALWLSAEVQVEELVALRLAVLEWQQRPAHTLLLNTAAPPRSSGMNGSGSFRGSPMASTASGFATSLALAPSTSPELDFANQDTRRERLLRFYLEELEYITKVCADLVSRSVVTPALSGVSSSGSMLSSGSSWIDTFADEITESYHAAGDVGETHAFGMACIKHIDARASESTTDKVPRVFTVDSSRTELYITASMRQMIDVLRLLLSSVYSLNVITHASLIRAWFELMDKTAFFQDPQSFALVRAPSTMDCLVSIISLAMFQLPHAVARLQKDLIGAQRGDAAYPSLAGGGDAEYILDEASTSQITLVLCQAAKQNISVASPAVYAWAVITTLYRALATEVRETRDHNRMEDGSSDNEALTRAPSRNPGQDTTAWEICWESLLEAPDMDDSDPAMFFVRSAVEQTSVYMFCVDLATVTAIDWDFDLGASTAFASRDIMLALLGHGMQFVRYEAPVLEAMFAILAPPLPDQTARPTPQTLIKKFLTDEVMAGPHIMTQCMSRYPYELSSFLQLFAILANTEHSPDDRPFDVLQTLETMQSFTVKVLPTFRTYVLEHEDEGSNSMVLTDSLALFTSRKAFSQGSGGQRAITNGETSHADTASFIPAGTSGQIVGEEKSKVLQLNHHHSVLQYLGLLLSTMLPSPAIRPALPCEELDRDTATEVIALVNALLQSSGKQANAQEQAGLILTSLSQALRNEQEIMGVIADIMEMELQDQLDQKAQPNSIDLLAACVEFLNILISFYPERIWATLGRSSLLGLNGGASSLAASVAGSELQSGKYRFLTACVRLYSNLIDDAIAGLIKRKAKPVRNGHRFEGPEMSIDSVPERLMSIVVTAYQRVMLDAFQNFAAWRFTILDEKHKMSMQIAATFHKLLRVTFGVEAPPPSIPDPGRSLVAEGRERFSVALMPAAQLVLEAFAPESNTSGLLATLRDLYEEGIKAADDVLPTRLRISVVQQTRELCAFTATLVRTMKMLDAERAAALSNELMKNTPTFVMLLAADPANKGPLSDLLSEITQAAALSDTDPPALLASLNPGAAKAFLTVISYLDKPIGDMDVEVKMWSFLSAVLGCRQQWFAVYLLTGTLPRTRLKDTKNTNTQAHSILAYALDELGQLANLAPNRAKVMLQFVAKAQDVWIWAANEMRTHAEFFDAALAWLDNVLPAVGGACVAEEVIQANEIKMAAVLCDILAVNIHTGLEVGDKSVVQKLKGHLGYLQAHAVKIDAYRRSLHLNLAENMRRKYPHCELADFKRTQSSAALYGDSFHYDLELAETVLKHDQAWTGAVVNGRNRGDGFCQEIVRANRNLSLVDAQTCLLSSWKTLASTLCDCAEQEAHVRTALAMTVRSCLQTNMDADLDIPGTAEALQSRADLAFILLSKLINIEATEPVMKELLPLAWSLLRTSPVDYDVASAPSDLQYYRVLLQVLYLTIQPHAYISLGPPPTRASTQGRAPVERGPPSLSADISSMFVEIVRHVIVTGFRALCGNLHTDLNLALPADFAMLTALLQAVLSVRGIASVHHLITVVIVDSSTIRGALSLYSWADQLAAVMADDPLYGEIAITFLLSLSTISPVAEQMALDGVLDQISNANISNYYRKPNGKGPFDEPVRMFTIWSEGLLPLSLNLLDAVGPVMAAEVAIFLNSFRNQLQRAESSLKLWAPGEATRLPLNSHVNDVTLGLVTEAHSLLLLGMILESDAINGAAEGVNATDIPPLALDLQMLKGLVAALPRSKRSLVDRIVPANEREVVWAQTAAKGSSSNLLAEKVIREVTQATALLGEATS